MSEAIEDDLQLMAQLYRAIREPGRAYDEKLLLNLRTAARYHPIEAIAILRKWLLEGRETDRQLTKLIADLEVGRA